PNLTQSRDRGEVASILIAAEYPIYGRFGYGPCAEKVDLVVDTRTIGFVGPRPPGTVELSDLGTLRKVGPAIYERIRPAQPGAITRTERWWDLQCRVVTVPGDEPFKGFIAIGRDEHGEPDGYLRYTAEVSWTDARANSTLHVQELQAA